ncbi:MAG: Exodeoxyribonuclease III [Holosporales bacterium]
MRIATWNVNSVRARLPIVLDWLKQSQCDVVLLQEIKCQETDFPKASFYDLGYNQAIFGQKTYNGVAILSKKPIEDVQCGLAGFSEEARYIEAVIGTKRFINVYVPNGSEIGCDKYVYKLDFLDALYNHLKTIQTYQEEVIIGGDFNIAPTDDDVHNPKTWKNSILCSRPERLALNKILNLGYSDLFRLKHPTLQEFSWWDYRNRSFDKNEGLRIDLLLASPQAADTVHDVFIDKAPREMEKASDHTPVVTVLK